jgi:hypothetical protein
MRTREKVPDVSIRENVLDVRIRKDVVDVRIRWNVRTRENLIRDYVLYVRTREGVQDVRIRKGMLETRRRKDFLDVSIKKYVLFGVCVRIREDVTSSCLAVVACTSHRWI